MLAIRNTLRRGGNARRHGSLQDSTQRGFVITWALLTIFILAGVIFSAMERVKSVDSMATFRFSADGQAEEVAQAGLVDALAWFRRQASQPVTVFQPDGLPPVLRSYSDQPPAKKMPPGIQNSEIQRPDPKLRSKSARPVEIVVTPAIEWELTTAPYYSLESIESEVPEIGLVRSFLMAPGVWARYTVTRGSGDEAFEDENQNGRWDAGESFTDANEDGRWSAARDTIDVSSERGLDAAGTYWHLTSIGEVFRRPRLDLPLGEGPNVRLAHSVWGTEIRRLTVSPPASAALCSVNASLTELGARARITGDTAVAHADGTGTLNSSYAELDGSVASVPDFDASVLAVFGVSWGDLMSMADMSTTDSVDGLPRVLPTNSLVVIKGDAEFSLERPLTGSAIVAVQGNATLEGGSNPFFSGVLYVDGNLTVRGPALLKGTVIVTGSVDIKGGNGDYVEITHDPEVVSNLLKSVGQYRHVKSPFHIRINHAPRVEAP